MSSCVNITISIIIVALKIGIALKHLKPLLEFRGIKLREVGEDGVGAAEDELHPAAGGRDLAAEADPGEGVVDEAHAEEAKAVREAGEGGDGDASHDGIALDDVATPGDVVDGGGEEAVGSGSRSIRCWLLLLLLKRSFTIIHHQGSFTIVLRRHL